MSDVSEPTHSVLPGVGTRLDLRDVDGRSVVAVRRRDGHVELHSDGRTVELGRSAALALGAFASGRFHVTEPLTERIADVLGGLQFDWARVRPDSHAAHRSIEELAVRRRTGVTIVAILRGSIPIVAPEPSAVLLPGDELVVACRPNDFEAFDGYLRTGRY